MVNSGRVNWDHSNKSSIIVTECMTLRDGILADKNNGFLSLEIEGASQVLVDC